MATGLDIAFAELVKRIERLQEEEKVLRVRAQGVTVLGKILQDSQEKNAILKKEIEQLKSSLLQKGEKQSSRCHSSMTRSSVGIHDYNINATTVSDSGSLYAGYPSSLRREFQKMKECYADEKKHREELRLAALNEQIQAIEQEIGGTSYGVVENVRDALYSGTYSLSNPLKVTILATRWNQWDQWAGIFTRQLARNLARFTKIGVQVRVLVPENAKVDQSDRRDAANSGVTIVKAKKQKGFLNGIDWLYCPPADLKTDIVIGIGTILGKIAQHWKERYQCKNIQIASSSEFDFSFQDVDSCIEDDIKELILAAYIPVGLGPKTSDNLTASLRSKGKQVFNLTPGIISELRNSTHATKDGKKFRVLLNVGDYADNFRRQELEIAARTVAELSDNSYHLIIVGAKKGREQQLANFFDQCGVPRRQLTIRSLPETEQAWKDLFCEVDLAIMPSGDKEFGWEALLALSAGLPVLVHGESGFGEALRNVTFGTSAIVDSDDAREWALRIKKVKETDRKTRLKQAARLRSRYDERYSWDVQCKALVAMM